MDFSIAALPECAAFVLEKLESAGHSAYIVGGCVRDMLMGQAPTDFDIATSATPCEVKGIFPRTVDIGIRHGTVAVLAHGGKTEVTTYRTDGEYQDGRRPQSVSFAGSILEDLSRRDFTVNAIAFNPKRGFADPFNGQQDIRGRLIRCVGDPHERLGEDALRIVRAVRFAATLGFDVDKSVAEGMASQKVKLENISAERIAEELRKLLLGNWPEALLLAAETGVLPHMLRGGLICEKSLPCAVLRIKKCPADFPLRLAVLLDGICDNEADVLKNLKLSGSATKAALGYLAHMHREIAPCKYEIKKLLRNLPMGMFRNLLGLWENTGRENARELARLAGEIERGGECYSLERLAIGGKDLAELGIKPGPEMGRVLASLLDEVMREPGLNEREALVERLRIAQNRK